MMTYAACLCLVFISMFYSTHILRFFNKKVVDITVEVDPELEKLDPIERNLKRIKGIRNVCGDLCDTSKKITPGEFIGSVTAKVDCKAMFQSQVIRQPADLPPQPWGILPPELKEMYTYGGRVEVADIFLDQAFMGGGRNEAKVFTKEDVEHYITSWLAGSPVDSYGNGSNLVAAAADFVDVAGKTILVMGTQDPWLEAVLLSKKPKKIVTLEYGYFLSEYPGYTFMRPTEFRERYLNGTLDTFDVVFTYSTVEHSGLGRYGDALNPWGDIMAVAEAWCVSKKNAKLAIAVPTKVSKHEDITEFNLHRLYGPVTYPFLTTNWKFVWPTEDVDRIDSNPYPQYSWEYEPVFVFEKNNNGFLE